MSHNDKHFPCKRRSQRLVDAGLSKKRRQGANDSHATTQTVSTYALLDLPVEIISLISNCLPMPWRISLALTCKALKATVFPGSNMPRLNGEDLGKFLSTLEKDVAKRYFCFCCNKLRTLDLELDWEGQAHMWALEVRNSLWPGYTVCQSDHIILPPSYLKFMRATDIHFMDARLIMNRHFYGPFHGIPLQSLERHMLFERQFVLNRCQHGINISQRGGLRSQQDEAVVLDWIPGELIRKEKAWRFSYRSIPKIFDDKLYIARNYTIVGPMVPWDHLTRLINSVKPQICNHLNCLAEQHPKFCPHIRGRTPGLNREGRLYIDDHQCWTRFGHNPETGSCRLCCTDYDASLNQDRDKQEWSFSLRTYHCLGSCRSPDDKLWSYFAGSPKSRDADLPPNFDAQYAHITSTMKAVDSRYSVLGHGRARQTWLENGVKLESSHSDR